MDYTLFLEPSVVTTATTKRFFRLGLYHTPMNEWLDLYDARFKQNEASTIERHRTMRQANPKCVLKNYMLDEAIREAQQGDY